jgi:hypothetical protein
MSRTRHHRHQRSTHCGEDYGSAHNCNRHYARNYGVYGRERLHSELRMEDKKLSRTAWEQGQ